jgi:hypothetical protein
MVKMALRISMLGRMGHFRVPAPRFGRGRTFVLEPAPDRARGVTLGDDLRLLATTFAGGLVFMTIYLG